jgi:hypothetical protein
VISSVLGLLGVIQSFGLLYLGDTVHHLQHPQLQTMMFLQLVAGGHLMLFVMRKEVPFGNRHIPADAFSSRSLPPKSWRCSCAAKAGSCRHSRGESLALCGLTTSCG